MYCMLKSLYCNRRKYDMYPSHTQCNKRITRKSKQLKIKNHKKNFVFFFPFFHSSNSVTATLSILQKGFSINTHTLDFLRCYRYSFLFFSFIFATKAWNFRMTDLVALNYLLCVLHCWCMCVCADKCVWICVRAEDNFKVVWMAPIAHVELHSFHLTQANAFRLVGFVFCFLFGVICVNNTLSVFFSMLQLYCDSNFLHIRRAGR